MADDPYANFVPVEAPATDAPQADAYARYPQSLTASPGDKYRAAALADREKMARAGIPLNEGYTNRMVQGATLGWVDELMAAGATPFAMAQHGTWDPREGYRYAKAREDLRQEKMRENTSGALGVAAEGVGGLVGGGVAAGAKTVGSLGRPLVEYGKNVAKGAGIGATAGAGYAPDVESIPKSAAMGGVLGAGVSGVVAPVVAGVARPVVNAMRAPETIATQEVAAAARAAGVTPQEIVRRVTEAHGAGQPYAVAEAIGKEGQRALAAQAKVPGAQRQRIAETITARDLNMPQRVGQEVGEQYGAPTTAARASAELIDRASTQAAPVYRRAETVPTWSSRLQTFLDDPIVGPGLRQGVELQRLRNVGTDRPFNPRDAMITGWNEAGEPIYSGVPNMQTLHTLKVGLDRMIQDNINQATGQLNARGNAIAGYRDRLIAEIDHLNPTYAEARRIYSDPMQVARAIEDGRVMPLRGRAEDNIAAYNAAPPTQQQGLRIGYADQVREQLERTGNYPGILREKSPKGVAEANAMANDPVRYRQFLNREEDMLRTSKAATGGSATAENLADMAVPPSVAADIAVNAVTGNSLGLARSVIGHGTNLLKGQTQAQRNAITDALLSREPSMVDAMARRIEEHSRRPVGPRASFVPPFVPAEEPRRKNLEE